MKTQIINKNRWIFRLMVVTAISVSACDKHNQFNEGLKCQVEAQNGQDDDLIGKWKLVLTLTARLYISSG